jgi:hypothetical protein
VGPTGPGPLQLGFEAQFFFYSCTRDILFLHPALDFLHPCSVDQVDFSLEMLTRVISFRSNFQFFFLLLYLRSSFILSFLFLHLVFYLPEQPCEIERPGCAGDGIVDKTTAPARILGTESCRAACGGGDRWKQ